MLYTIGLSFAAEMGLKGLYELTIGRFTAWFRGPKRTPEDEFALAVAEDYAAFLRQTPWYEYPFGSKLAQFWIETPMAYGSAVRKLERRIALSLEYGGKAVYAKLIGLGAAASPAPLTIRSVVKGLDAIRSRRRQAHHAHRPARRRLERDRDAALPRLHRDPAGPRPRADVSLSRSPATTTCW